MTQRTVPARATPGCKRRPTTRSTAPAMTDASSSCDGLANDQISQRRWAPRRSARLAADQREQLGGLFAHQRLIAAALDVQADQGLGVRRAQVETPAVEFDAHAVGVVDALRTRLVLRQH